MFDRNYPLDDFSYDDTVSFMKPIIDGWQSFIKAELGCAKLTEELESVSAE